MSPVPTHTPNRLRRTEISSSIETLKETQPADMIRWGWHAQSSDDLVCVSIHFADSTNPEKQGGVITGRLSINAITCEDDSYSDEELLHFAEELTEEPEDLGIASPLMRKAHERHVYASKNWCTIADANDWLITIDLVVNEIRQRFTAKTRDGGWFRIQGVHPDSLVDRFHVMDTPLRPVKPPVPVLKIAAGLLAMASLILLIIYVNVRPGEVIQVAATTARADGKKHLSGESQEERTGHVLTLPASRWSWAVFYVDRNGLSLLGEFGASRSPQEVEYRTPAFGTTSVFYLVAVPTVKRCPPLFACLQSAFTSTFRAKVTSPEYLMEDEESSIAKRDIGEVVRKCGCVHSEGEVLVLRRSVAKSR